MENLKRRSLVILISDLFDTPEQFIGSIKRVKFTKSEVIIFHILDPAETSFKYEKEAIFEDMETGKRIEAQPWLIRKEYRKRINEFVKGIEYELRESMVDYVPIDTSTPFEISLLAYLYKRERLM